MLLLLTCIPYAGNKKYTFEIIPNICITNAPIIIPNIAVFLLLFLLYIQAAGTTNASPTIIFANSPTKPVSVPLIKNLNKYF